MMKIKFFVLILPIIFLLDGCAGMNKFDCPMKPGIRCESLDQANAQVDHGDIGHDNSQASIRSTRQSKISTAEPLRYGETVQRIWIAPFEDTAGNYHQESEVYTVAKTSHWIGNPPKEMGADGE
jgi:conjugal transfer pilus assembly protein TraV